MAAGRHRGCGRDRGDEFEAAVFGNQRAGGDVEGGVAGQATAPVGAKTTSPVCPLLPTCIVEPSTSRKSSGASVSVWFGAAEKTPVWPAAPRSVGCPPLRSPDRAVALWARNSPDPRATFPVPRCESAGEFEHSAVTFVPPRRCSPSSSRSRPAPAFVSASGSAQDRRDLRVAALRVDVRPPVPKTPHPRRSHR